MSSNIEIKNIKVHHNLHCTDFKKYLEGKKNEICQTYGKDAGIRNP